MGSTDTTGQAVPFQQVEFPIVELPKEITNEVIVEDSKSTRKFVYVGRAYNMWWSGLEIRGNASLSKHEIVYKERRRIISVIPFRMERSFVEKRNHVWTFADDDRYSSAYLISSSGPKSASRIADGDFACIPALLVKLLNRNKIYNTPQIMISPAFLDNLFRPIMDRLVALRSKVAEFQSM